jgi:quinol monooxygenase YgiN
MGSSGGVLAVVASRPFYEARWIVGERLDDVAASAHLAMITKLDVHEHRRHEFESCAQRLKEGMSVASGVKMVWYGPASPHSPVGTTAPYLVYEDWRTAAELRRHWRSEERRDFFAEIHEYLAGLPTWQILGEEEHTMRTRVMRTGASQSWDTEGKEIDGTGTGQDGDVQAGIDPPVDRFKDNGDGTVRDLLTDLVWLKDADAFGEVTWEEAVWKARRLSHGSKGLTDHSAKGDWRLANIRELLSLIDYGQANPILPRDFDKSFTNVKSAIYWTSTTLTPAPRLAWMMTLGIGPTVFVVKDAPARMWPVRGTSKVVLQTGQEDAWDADGKHLSSANGSGQDGDLKAGVSLPVASRRFDNQKNGTIRDRLTGLVWLKDADAFGFKTWSHALACCNALENGDVGLSDGSKPGDWRLPNIREIESLVDYGRVGPCLPQGHEQFFTRVRPSSYWTSTTVMSGPAQAMFIILGVGPSIFEDKDHQFFVWPVRDSFPHEDGHP